MIFGVEDRLQYILSITFKSIIMNFENPKTQEAIIIKATSLHFGLEVDDFLSRKENDHHKIYQRQLCMYIIKLHTIISYKKTGSFFGLTETGAKSGVYRIKDLIVVDRRTKDDLKEIQIIIDKFTNQKKNEYA